MAGKPIRISLQPAMKAGYDPKQPDTVKTLVSYIEELCAQKREYRDYALSSIDKTKGTAVLKPVGMIAMEPYPGEITEQYAGEMKEGYISRNLSMNHPGMTLTDMDEYRRTISYAPLPPDLLKARSRFAAALGRKPWEIKVRHSADNGYVITLNKTCLTPYVESKHGKRLQEEVDTVAGRKGWFYKPYPMDGIILVHPGELPTFPKAIPMPQSVVDNPDPRYAWFGMKLPQGGRKYGDPIKVDWTQTAMILLIGGQGSGKSVLINSLIFCFLNAGGRLVVVDDRDKALDFNWCRPYVSKWGADSPETSAAALKWVLEREVPRRAEAIKQAGVENYWQMPREWKENPDNRPMLVVCDEMFQYCGAVSIPKGLDKDNPDLLQAKYDAAIHASCAGSIDKIAAKARFTGICLLCCSQDATVQTGISTFIRKNSAVIIPGDKVAPSVYENLLKDRRNAPTVPGNLIEQGVSKGCGVAETDGEDCVYKAYYEDRRNPDGSYVPLTGVYRERLMRLHPVPDDPEAGRIGMEEVLRLVPAAGDKPDGSSDNPPSRLQTEGGWGADPAPKETQLRGAAKAAHALKQAAPSREQALKEAVLAAANQAFPQPANTDKEN